MGTERDILDLLQDFDHYGNTATERFTMRKRAHDEIKLLRKQLAEERERSAGWLLAAKVLAGPMPSLR